MPRDPYESISPETQIGRVLLDQRDKIQQLADFGGGAVQQEPIDQTERPAEIGETLTGVYTRTLSANDMQSALEGIQILTTGMTPETAVVTRRVDATNFDQFDGLFYLDGDSVVVRQGKDHPFAEGNTLVVVAFGRESDLPAGPTEGS